MATFTMFYSLPDALSEKVHNWGTDQLKLALTNAANPPSRSNTKLSDLTEISYTNCSPRNVTTTSANQSSGVLKLILAVLTITASGGSMAAFRYIILYNDSATNKELIGYIDMGSDVTLLDTHNVPVNFDQTNGVLSTSLTP